MLLFLPLREGACWNATFHFVPINVGFNGSFNLQTSGLWDQVTELLRARPEGATQYTELPECGHTPGT